MCIYYLYVYIYIYIYKGLATEAEVKAIETKVHLSVCVMCGSPVWPSLRWWVLCGVLTSVWVPCGQSPPLSYPRFPWHLFLVLPPARAHTRFASTQQRGCIYTQIYSLSIFVCITCMYTYIYIQINRVNNRGCIYTSIYGLSIYVYITYMYIYIYIYIYTYIGQGNRDQGAETKQRGCRYTSI